MEENVQIQAQIPKTVKVKKTRNRLSNQPLSEEELKKLIESITEPRDHALILLGANSGMRVSEAVHVEKIGIQEAEGQITIWDEKKNRYRNVRLPAATISTLLRYWATLQTSRLFDFTEKTAENIIQEWTLKVLGKKKSWHCLRHTYVTLSAMKNTPVPVVAENTGDSPTTLYRVYTNLPPQVVKRIVEENAVYKESVV